MAKRIKKKRSTKARNTIMACVAKNDPARFRTRTVQSEKEKDRPRNSNRRARYEGKD